MLIEGQQGQSNGSRNVVELGSAGQGGGVGELAGVRGGEAELEQGVEKPSPSPPDPAGCGRTWEDFRVISVFWSDLPGGNLRTSEDTAGLQPGLRSLCHGRGDVTQ